MTSSPDSSPEHECTRKDHSPPDIFERLRNRGIEYTYVKNIVQFQRPHDRLIFAQWFKGRTIKQVFWQLDEWKALLKKDFILSLSKDLKTKVEQDILRTELFVWRALIEANPGVGAWDLHIRFLPTGRNERGKLVYIHPARQIVAVHRETKKRRRALIPGGESLNPSSEAAAWRRAFEELRLWDRLWKGDPSGCFISKHSPQGWRVYTRLIIPRLYDFMVSHYKSPGHHWARHSAGSRRLAEMPKELLVDMLEILRMEHPHAFGQTTLPQLKADVQHHLQRRRPKKPKELSRQKNPNSLN